MVLLAILAYMFYQLDILMIKKHGLIKLKNYQVVRRTLK